MRKHVCVTRSGDEQVTCEQVTCDDPKCPKKTRRDRPILFSAPMVLALLAGRKQMTRRLLGMKRHGWPLRRPRFGGELTSEEHAADRAAVIALCPYGQVGDRLWVKETWRVGKKHDRTKPTDLPFDRGLTTAYAAGGIKCRDSVGGPYVSHPESDLWNADWLGKVRPSLFMTRAASRLTLEITDVRIERVQAITEADAIAEGVEQRTLGTAKFWRGYAADEEGTPGIAITARESFASLWSVINGEKSWDANPWVWVVSFKLLDEVTP